MGDKELEYDQLTDLVSGEIDRQLKTRTDVLDTMKSQMTKVFQEFEELTWNVQAKRSWMKSVGKTRDIHPTGAVAIHPIITSGNIAPNVGTTPTSPSRLPKLSGLKARKKLQQQLNRNISGTLPPAEGVPSDARQEGKIVFDKKLPRVAHMEKRVDGLQSMLASQQKQQMYEKALIRYPQCRSNVFAPSIYDDPSASDAPPLAAQPPPRTTLELEFVYGVNNGVSASSNLSQSNAGAISSNTSIANNVSYLSSGEVVWFTATIVVLYSKENNAQRYFREHTNQVTSIAVHPNRHIVASGQAGRETFVLVWDSNDDPLGKRFACLRGHHVAVRCISFSHDGKLVASLGGDIYNTICIHDWRDQSLLVSARGHSFRVHSIAFNPYQAYGRPETKRGKKPGQALQDDDVCYTLVSCGVRHIRFWTLTKTEFAQPPNEESEDSAFYGSSFGGPARLNPPAPQERVWKLEGNVPSFHGRLDVQDFTSITFVDDSPPLYVYDEQAKELVATDANDHSFGRIIAGTVKGDVCVFWQPRRGPDIDDIPAANRDKEPAKWWEIPNEYSDAEINELVLEKILYEPSAKLVEVVPHDVETGNRFKASKASQVEIDGIQKRLQVKPNSASLHARLAELKYSGPFAHQGCVHQLAFCKKNSFIISVGADSRLVLWKCQLNQPVRVPGVSMQGVFTPLTGTFHEGSHSLRPLDEETKVFKLPSQYPDDPTVSAAVTPKPTSVAWREDGKSVLVGTSANAVWELNILTGDWKLLFEGRSGVMAACSCHPSKEEVVSVSSDGFLTVWDLRRHVCKRRAFIGGEKPSAYPIKPTYMEFHPFGDEIAIALNTGELIVVSYPDLRVLKRKTIKAHVSINRNDAEVPSTSSCTPVVVKYDPNADVLAVGAKDTFVYVFDAKNGYKKLHVCEGHSSSVVQLTWSVDGDTLQSNAADGEVLFWSRTGGTMKQITDAFQARDKQWAKWTCVFGWATAGIWPDDSSNLVDIAAVATSTIRMTPPEDQEEEASGTSDMTQREQLLVVANRNTLRLFRWPVPRGSKSRTYHAHSSLISSVCFSFNDRYVLSAGSDDGTLIQWRCVGGDANLPIASPRKDGRRKPQFRLSQGDADADGSSDFMASPVPPTNANRGNHSHPSPRQVSRQYRERSAADSTDSVPPRTPAGTSTPTTVLAQCRAKHDFKGENSDELSLTAGELVRVLTKENADWWYGESCDGTRGIFPSNYVEEVPLDESATTDTDDAALQSTAVATAEVVEPEVPDEESAAE